MTEKKPKPARKPLPLPVRVALACIPITLVMGYSFYSAYADRQKREAYEKRREERQAKIEAMQQAKAAAAAQAVPTVDRSMLEISAESMGKDWPLTVDKAILRCDARGAIFVYVIGQGKFGVNGTADATKDFQVIWPIVKANPDPKMAKFVPKASLQPLFTEGQKLCGPK